ncbi:T9SS type B sorting domain-containing protein [Chryseobacterium sp.]|uniref:T9SS type B sorting domain-containing protein n=1 Tax=Chryseobacterium sp. TaxID=1871047 RepID=UPI00388E59D7
MKKILSFFLFLCIYCVSFAQLDREHWFAPMVDRSGNPNPNQKVYLSTSRVTPFPVSIYNNNVLIGTVNISKNNPQKFDILRNYIITNLQTDLFTPTSKGIYLKADFPFYANLRFSVYNHAEIITSKGIASTGKNFYAAFAPITVSNTILNFMTSILATQDNTTVTLSGYKSTTQFSNGTTGATNPTITFTLNKGQSYIIDGSGDLTGNSDGFLGAKIVANKPINVTNGNFNGQYAGNVPLSSDILMDQSIPVEQLGSQFALVKGNGTIGSHMEGALVIATQNNTQVYVNDETIPVVTLNSGQYYVIQDTKYKLQGTNHYNLYIRTTQNAYVYQILAGDNASSTELATGGFNFIPALNCYLPKRIDEIGLINENFVYTNANPLGILNVPTKLNLITERGAVVTVNGANPPAGTGPYDMTGISNWVTYGIPNTVGNITVVSSKAITAGITAGSDAVGYGGFFAGFATQPEIIKSGSDCAPGIILTADPLIYDNYQWYLNGVIIPGATNSTYSPTASGNYTCSVTMGSCAPLVTALYKVQNCTKLTHENITICSPKTFVPTFSNSTQTPVINTISILTAPTSGNATINATTGVITYTPNNANIPSTDTFIYTFFGNNPDFPDCETVTVNINYQPLLVQDAALTVCSSNNSNNGFFNLNNANITSNTPVTTTFYTSLLAAQNEDSAGLITVPTNYSASSGTFVYALVKNNTGCKEIAKITLNLFPKIIVTPNSINLLCDDNFDGIFTVTLSDITPIILTNSGYFTNVNYYADLTDAMNNTGTPLPNNWSITANTTIYIRVQSPDGCGAVVQWVNLQVGSKVPVLVRNHTQSYCDEDLDGSQLVDLNQYLSNFTTDPAVTAQFFNSLADAQNNISPLANPITLSGSHTFFVRLEKQDLCSEIVTLILNIKSAKKSEILQDKKICPNTKTTLDAGPGFDTYLWSTGDTTSSITNVGIGNYWVELGFNGCTYKQFVNVSESSLPVITSIDINETTVTIGVTGGIAPYEYSLDGIFWQPSNIFTNIGTGNYKIFVRDSLQCKEVVKDFVIINLINTITPNGDGINDMINYASLMSKDNLEFRIFDRYGAEVFRGTPSNQFTWDGNIKGRPVPTATYWYFISWTEFGSSTTVKYSSWLLVKHRNDNLWDR